MNSLFYKRFFLWSEVNYSNPLFFYDFLSYYIWVVSKSGNPGPGPVPNSYFLYYIFIKALILIKFEHNA
jgi:hypothetical protein